LGKTQLVLGLLGFLAYIFSSIFQKKHLPKGAGKYFVVIFFGIMSLYMMFSVSTFLWKTFSFVLAAFQFPWRFNSFFLFFISFFAGYLIWALKNRTLNIIILPLSLLLVVAMLVSSRPYFRHPWRLSYNEYYLKYVSDEYIYKKIAYTIPEYLPRTANYQIWMDYGSTQKTNTGPNSYVPFIGSNKGISITKNSSYEKQMTSLIDQDVTINTIYFPFWEITVDNKVVTPKLFDFLGRPVLSVTKSSTIRVRYRETLIEIIGNYITILTIIGLGSVALSKKLWNRLNNINT